MNEKETKTHSPDSVSSICQNCKNQFIVEPEDFNFYKKINVPPPTWCPESRLQRRLLWRNERTLYKRQCNAPNHSEALISNFAPEVSSPVYDQEFWWSDNWEPLQYGREYDFTQPFFEQFKKLFDSVPVPNLTNLQSVQSDYCNFTYQCKNCYLVFASNFDEDSGYLCHAERCKSSFDQLGCGGNEHCYECIHSHKCHRCAYTFFSTECMNSSFLYNCRNCRDCFGCVNLRNAQYFIFNERYSKEEYEQKLLELNAGSFGAQRAAAARFEKLTMEFPRKFATAIQAVRSSGDYLKNVKNCLNCFDCEGPVEDSKYVVYGVPNAKDCFDSYGVGENAELVYETTVAGDSTQRCFFSFGALSGNSNQYSYFCRGCSNIFGCVGLRNKEYCILNKQYSKEEYLSLLPKVIEHMNVMPYVAGGKIYRYGEFFPPGVCPFAYNETIAQEYFPLSKEEALSQGYRWKDPETKEYKVTIKSESLPDHIKDVDDGILKETIQCAHTNISMSDVDRLVSTCNEQCTTAFKIIKEELRFYRKMNLPLPRLCPNCRHYQRLKQRNPLKLWHRQCQCAGGKSENGVYSNTATHSHRAERCPNEFETSYSPERKEIVYCEQCYQAEVI